MEDIPPETLADPASARSHGARVMVYDPSNKAVLYKLSLAKVAGKMSFISEAGRNF